MGDNRVGHARCPDCGVVPIARIEDITLHIGTGLANPIANIVCSNCHKAFLNCVEWKSAWTFDGMGAQVEGFSRRTAVPLTEEDAEVFEELFDEFLEEFLATVDEESES